MKKRPRLTLLNWFDGWLLGYDWFSGWSSTNKSWFAQLCLAVSGNPMIIGLGTAQLGTTLLSRFDQWLVVVDGPSCVFNWLSIGPSPLSSRCSNPNFTEVNVISQHCHHFRVDLGGTNFSQIATQSKAMRSSRMPRLLKVVQNVTSCVKAKVSRNSSNVPIFI